MSKPQPRIRVMSILIMSLCTLASRVLGFVRELLFVRYLGAKLISDAFLTAISIPNTFYEIFVGGACGSAVLPFLIKTRQTVGKLAVDRLLTAFVMTMLGIISVVCLVIARFPAYLLGLLVPGFIPEQIAATVMLLRVFLFFMLTSAATSILAEALRAERFFLIPAMGQIVVNSAFILGLIMYGFFNASIITVAYCIVGGGVAQCVMHIFFCWWVGYRLALPDRVALWNVTTLLHRFVPCMMTSGINEVALFIERQFASYLPVGSISLMTYASSIMRLPFGLLVHPLTTVILPEFAKVQEHRSRMAFLMFESCTLIVWVLVPLITVLGYFSYDIFATLYGASQLSGGALVTLQHLLLIKLCGLVFLSLNHVCLHIFYARHEVYVPTMVSLITASSSIAVTYGLYPQYGMYGIAIASVMAVIMRTIIFMALLHGRIAIGRYIGRLRALLIRAVIQWMTIIPVWLLGVTMVRQLLRSTSYGLLWYSDGMGLWLWVGPCTILLAGTLWYTRQVFGLRFYCVK